MPLAHRTPTCSPKTHLLATKPTTQGYGVPYFAVVFDAPGSPAADFSSLLWDARGASGRFSAITMIPDLEASGSLTAGQISDLQDYARRTGARVLKFGASPAAYGLSPAPCTSSEGDLAFTSSTPFGLSGLRPGAVMQAKGLKRCGRVCVRVRSRLHLSSNAA